jgi:glycosyltransferase involved in cell wall biosynthesis
VVQTERLDARTTAGRRAGIPPRRKHVHLWFPDLHAKGGIQVYSTFFLRALVELFPELRLTVVVKNDPLGATQPWLERRARVVRTGHWPRELRTAAFSSRLAVEYLRDLPALVICGHLNFTGAAYWLRRATGVPYWAIAHGVEAWNLRSDRVRRAVCAADRIISVSHYTADRLVAEQGVPAGRVSILPNTFDPELFRPGPKPAQLLQRYRLSPNARVIMTVARLHYDERYKGYAQIIKALPTIRHYVPDVHYLVIGSGNDRQRIERLIDQHRLRDHVTLAGFVPDAELPDHYRLCDVFAMPSKKEGFGIVYLEALSCGKPVLAGNRDGALDALCGGELGVLVDPDDPQAIGGALIEMLQGSHPLAILKDPERLRRRVIEEFAPRHFAEKLKALCLGYGPCRQEATDASDAACSGNLERAT